MEGAGSLKTDDLSAFPHRIIGEKKGATYVAPI